MPYRPVVAGSPLPTLAPRGNAVGAVGKERHERDPVADKPNPETEKRDAELRRKVGEANKRSTGGKL
ncbi:hypothetical protein GCM10010319_05960 [Streptomyces blastmyceticus]|uniref:Uncharacterized protein n=1 Tax=Streptomyces blastmyceticus TaxID=68180 RepID=A0ABP3G3G2_9ACTN